jgi:large subunit ribosomal protein L6
MSRVAKMPVAVPSGVEVTVTEQEIQVKGANGILKLDASPLVSVKVENSQVLFAALGDSQEANALSGTYRAITSNMVEGVTKGFERKLNLVGVGYRAQAQGAKLNLQVGYSHPVVFDMPAGVKVETPSQTEIILKGANRQVVGQLAAEIRAVRPPEPYKGKGIRYADERVTLKETKKK